MLKIFSYIFTLAILIVLEILSFRLPIPIIIKMMFAILLIALIIFIAIQLYRQVLFFKKSAYVEAIKQNLN